MFVYSEKIIPVSICTSCRSHISLFQVTVLPMMDSLIVLEVTGKQIVGALENGVSLYPRLEGRFPQVSTSSCIVLVTSILVSGKCNDLLKILDVVLSLAVIS